MKKKSSYSSTLKTIAINVKKYRTQRGLTQEQMAELGFNYRFYQKLESGAYSPNLRTLFNLSQALGIEISQLFE